MTQLKRIVFPTKVCIGRFRVDAINTDDIDQKKFSLYLSDEWPIPTVKILHPSLGEPFYAALTTLVGWQAAPEPDVKPGKKSK